MKIKAVKLHDNDGHGNRGGGALHNVAQTNSHGFMSAEDKVILDDLAEAALVAVDPTDEIAELDAAGVILTELQTMSFLLTRILSAATPGVEIDLDQLRTEMTSPASELKTVNWLLSQLLAAVEPSSNYEQGEL